MVISGTLIPQRTNTISPMPDGQQGQQMTKSQITGLAIRSGVMHRGESPPSDINVIYQINNWKSYPKLVAAAQSCQDLDYTYCSMSLKARIKPVSAPVSASQPVKLVDIVQLIEVCTSRATGRSMPFPSCKPGIEYEDHAALILADLSQIGSDYGPCALPDGSKGQNTIAGCIRIPPTLPTRPIPRRIPREPEVTPDLSKYLIVGCVAVSLFLSILALKSSS
jgi:hypothetical protein